MSNPVDELLAVIHRDAGQYQARHGTDKAATDALPIARWLRQSLNASGPAPEYYRHVKTGRLYVVGERGLQESDQMPVVIYKSVDDGRWWVRPASEFDDGRFQRLPEPAAPQPIGGDT